MQSVILTEQLAQLVRPRTGRVLLEVPRHSKIAAEVEGFVRAKLYAPDAACDHQITETHQKARVLKVGYGAFYEDGVKYPGVTEDDFAIGDTVIFRPLLLELNAPFILTDVRRVDARIES